MGVLDRREIQRGQQTVGIDEALNNLPGVVVANRYNYSLDQRISIRGFGSRSNFGVRGLKILLDGIPQTLPDGQSQLTNVDFADLDRAEVLRGASSSLYGNASGGVISLQTQGADPGPFAQKIRVQGGGGQRDGDGFYKWQSWTSARSGPASGTLSISQFKADGFRQHSAGEFRLLNAGLDYAFSGSTLGTFRLGLADNPEAAEPGGTDAGRVSRQPRFGRGQQHQPRRRQGRTAVPAGPGYEALRRREQRVRAQRLRTDAQSAEPARRAGRPEARRPRGPTWTSTASSAACAAACRASSAPQAKSPRLTAGADLQLMRDDRVNLVQDAGVPTGTVLLDQREKVTELGPFAQVQWSPDGAAAAERWSAVRLGALQSRPTTFSPTVTTAASAPCHPRAGTSGRAGRSASSSCRT